MNELAPSDIVLRFVTPEDTAFIIQSWVKSYWQGFVSFCHEISPPIYNKNQRRVIENILTDCKKTSLVAHVPEEPDVIIGWAVIEKRLGERLVHYVYVKEAFRKFGIAERLVGREPFTYTHLTRRAQSILDGRRGFTFNPWLLAKDNTNDESELSRQAGVETHGTQWGALRS